MPRPVEHPDPDHLTVCVVDYLRHKIVECLQIANQPTWRRFVFQCGMTVDANVSCCCEEPRFDQTDQQVTCYGCGGT